ncbi:MAG: hypothetical protein WD577_05270 [Bacteroidales bacterium]
MKQHIGRLNILGIISLVILSFGCQEEFSVITEPDKTAVFSTSDTIVGLILKMTMKDGSFDDIIDNCSEISINFPYEIQIRNETFTISSQDDLEQLALNYDQFKNTIIIKFPVTVTFKDYSETVLNNRGELQIIQNQCNRNKEDDNIECIDFIYPFNINLYNIQYQKPEFVSVGGDKELHGLLKNRNDILFEIDYPIFAELYDGTVLKLENNLELEREIMNVVGICGGDELELNDDDQH